MNIKSIGPEKKEIDNICQLITTTYLTELTKLDNTEVQTQILGNNDEDHDIIFSGPIYNFL